MKKVLLVLISALLITGCAHKSSSADSMTIKLKSNPSTGYQWTYEETEDIIGIDESYDDSACSSDAVGCAGEAIFKLKGIKEGKTTLKLTYRRSWEESEYDLEAVYELEVDKDLNIKELSHEGSYFNE